MWVIAYVMKAGPSHHIVEITAAFVHSCILSAQQGLHRGHIPTYLAHKTGDSGKYPPMYRTDPSKKNYLAQM